MSESKPSNPSGTQPPDSRPNPHHSLGAFGEALAAEYLEAEGYRILARNERAGGVELDLVVARGSLLVFVEVKTRRGLRYGRPEEAVHAAKQARLRRGALAWMREHRRRGRVRFDVIAISPGAEGDWVVDHLPGAFDGGDC